jgi:hypothetical protein
MDRARVWAACIERETTIRGKSIEGKYAWVTRGRSGKYGKMDRARVWAACIETETTIRDKSIEGKYA